MLKFDKYTKKLYENFEYIYEKELLTNQIDPNSKFYYKQNFYSYWISCSHNTYLPYGQIFDPASVCYYRLHSMIYFGGCLEIDTVAVTEDKQDIIITHLKSNTKTIYLSDVLEIIVFSMQEKKRKNIVSGPIVLTIDNKEMVLKGTHDVFWNIIEKTLIKNDMLLKITDDFDMTQIKIEDMSDKVLIRWGENNKCDKNTPIDTKVGKEVCPPDDSIRKQYTESKSKSWVHLHKGHMKFTDQVANKKNATISTSVNFKQSVDPVNLIVTINTFSNMMRIYPHFTNIQSGNYGNIKYYRDGVQMCALNLQHIACPLLLNKAIFLPNTGIPCSPENTSKSTSNIESCFLGWKNNSIFDNASPQSYRLKPLWLMGLVPYPKLYNLHLKITKVEHVVGNKYVKLDDSYNKFMIINGLTNEESNHSKYDNIVLSDMDVTVPFFTIELSKFGSSYQTGCEFKWSILETDKEQLIDIDLYKFEKTFNGYNKVDISETNYINDCDSSEILNIRKTVRITVLYKWTNSNSKKNEEHQNHIKQYNANIDRVRKEYSKFNTYDFLSDISLLTKYQSRIAHVSSTLLNMPNSDYNSMTNEEDMSDIDDDYDMDYEL